MEKEEENKVIEIIEGCKVYRDAFILKRELMRKLEEAFPEKKHDKEEENQKTKE